MVCCTPHLVVIIAPRGPRCRALACRGTRVHLNGRWSGRRGEPGGVRGGEPPGRPALPPPGATSARRPNSSPRPARRGAGASPGWPSVAAVHSVEAAVEETILRAAVHDWYEGHIQDEGQCPGCDFRGGLPKNIDHG